MKVKHRYSFKVDNSTKNIIKFLDEINITYKMAKGISFLSFDINEDSEHWLEVYSLMKKSNKDSISSCIYTKKEKQTAKWLRIRTKSRAGYPQPENMYKELTYNNSKYCSNCGQGSTQNNDFRLLKKPVWGNKNFLMLNLIESEIFTTKNCMDILSDGHIKGLKFRSVLNNKTMDNLDNTFQFNIQKTLDTCFVHESSGSILNKCSQCSSKKYLVSGAKQLVFNKEAFTINHDIVKTNESFGDNLVCLKMILISNKLYKAILEYKWEKDFIIEPIVLI